MRRPLHFFSSVSRFTSCHIRRNMASTVSKAIHFGQFEVTPQVFYNTPLSFALVNLKPLLPGHVLVSPHRVVPRLTDLTTDEVTDLFTTVQKVEKMLARVTFSDSAAGTVGKPKDGSFNIAVQDGAEAGQTIPHVHCHIIPRRRNYDEGLEPDEIYAKLAGDEGNVGGALWDREHRPKPQGAFPKIEDADREARTAEVMAKEAKFYKEQMELLETET